MNEKRYDYIITGGGTAGCVLANRLSKDKNIKVLLIEAGPKDTNPLIHMPIGFGFLAGKLNWKFTSSPQKYCQDREISLVQGRVLGGGGSINAQVFTRGVPQDYDYWEKDHQCEGWSFKDIQKYFIRSERNARLSGKWHGTEGLLGVSDLPQLHELSKAFIKAGEELGLNRTDDFNGEKQEGIGAYQTTTWKGKRCSAAVGYLKPVLARPNLKVITNSQIHRIIIESNRATGIETITNGKITTFKCDREVLVTAGAIGSPKLLLLSGIGDPKELKEVGIDVKIKLPGVGKNLQDHCDVDIMYGINKNISIDKYKKFGLSHLFMGLDYLLFKKGLCASNVVEAGAFTFVNPKEKTPDMQFHFLPAAGVEEGVAGLEPGFGCTLNSYFLRPRSRGCVKLTSSDPTKRPSVDPNYLEDDYDFEQSVLGLKQSREIMSQPAMAKYIVNELDQGEKLDTREGLQNYVRRFGRTSYHPVGTCKMGKGNDAVVDPRLNVIGVKGLRVCDSSIMPAITSSNTQAPTVMVAEKASDMILEDV